MEVSLLERQSYRQFNGDKKIEEGDVEGLLGEALEGQGLERVKLYVNIKGRGYYKYEKGRLIKIINEEKPEGIKLYGGQNREIYKGSSFALYFVSEAHEEKGVLKKVEVKEDESLIEAGKVGQSLMMICAKEEIGLCPIGIFNNGSLNEKLKLEKGNEIIYSFLGGSISEEQRESWNYSDENGGSRDEYEEVKEYLSRYLPDYMVPRVFIRLGEFPLTANGKVDRKALPNPFKEGLVRSKEYVAPRNETEEKLVVLWQEVLGIERIGINDNFFELGATSLVLIQFNNKLKTIVGFEIPLVALYTYPTIRLLLNYIYKDEDQENKIQENTLHNLETKKRHLLKRKNLMIDEG
jgi:acyl carrier protein